MKDYESYLNDRKRAEQEAESIGKPEKKHKFTEKAREANKSKYQQLRRENSELGKLNKMYNITKTEMKYYETNYKKTSI